MTPQEKAKELIKKFHPFTYTAVHAHKTSGEYADAIQCALIAVDEIVKTLNEDIKDINVVGNILLDLIDYWREVKQEIEQL